MMQMEQFLQRGSSSDFSTDLDLIEVLWRQDVDLGVGKEVFDPNLRKELEQERELEQRKEQEKRQEAEKRERERQQQAQQWLSQNFIRDGETGELMPIAGNSSFSPAEPTSLHSESNFPATLEEALNFVGELQVNQSYGQQAPAQQQAITATGPGGHYTAESGQYLADNLMEPPHGHNYTHQSDLDRLEQSWKEVVEQIFTDTTPQVANSTQCLAPVSVDNQSFLPDTPYLSEPPFYPPLQPPAPLTPTMDSFLMADNNHHNHTLSSAASMTETRRLLHQNSTDINQLNSTDIGHLNSTDMNQLNSSDLGQLSGLLQNASLPLLALDANLSVLDVQPLTSEPGMVSGDHSPVGQGVLPSLDLEGSELLFDTGLSNMTPPINTTDLLNSTDLLTGLLPVTDLDMAMEEAGLDTLQMLDDAGSDSAISMGSGSPQQDVNETMQLSPFDGLEGATGGSDYDNATYSHHRSHVTSTSAEEEHYQYSCSSYGSPASVNTNCSTGSNDTEHSTGHSSALHHIHHNHTYPTQPGHTPREVKKYAKKDGPRQKGPQSRDMKRAEDLKLPFTFEQIVGSPVEEFNDLLTKTKLSETQIALMRDIRRRGKNKVAAQNCRKRKLDVLVNLEEDMVDMQRMRDKLAEERRQIDLHTRQAREKYNTLYNHIFSALRDEQGRPYNPAEYSLQQSSDGNVFLVRKSTGSATSPTSSSSSSSGSKHGKDCDPQQHKDSAPPHKKKSK